MLLLIGGEDDDEIMKNIIHHCLEGRGGVGEADEHHQGLIQPSVGHKGRFPLVTSFDPDVVVSPPDIELCEEHSSTELVYHLSDQWQGVAIFDRDRV
ncbi:hypothetical protein IEO21_10257 [Rhodonia placenta]|uniref:Uncharacterized protein n=1 Tax=Rhodonia placenta TaxID=104341 RepID=A0A8H7NSU0_9APHY|nr:hypothetical protein IEO21_10257 [Postia placenta]